MIGEPGRGGDRSSEGSRQPRILFLVNVDAVTSVPLELAGAIEEEGAAVEVVSFYRDESRRPSERQPIVVLEADSPLDRRAWRSLAGLLAHRRPDVIHLHHTASAVAGAVLGRLRGVPVVVKTEHYDHRRAGWAQSAANALVFALVDRIVTNSRATLDSFRRWERALVRDKVVTLHNGVPVSRIEEAATASAARRRLGILPSAFLVGTVGRLVAVKNLELLLEGAAAAASGVPELQVVVAGGGPLRTTLERRAGQLHIEDRVRFTGELDRSAVHGLLGALDLFVVTSRSEGFCNAAVEAMAAGVPLLCVDIPALREVAGEVGDFVEPGDADALAAGIVRAARRDPQEYSRRAHAGRRRARQRFDLRSAARRHLELYRRLLDGQAGWRGA